MRKALASEVCLHHFCAVILTLAIRISRKLSCSSTGDDVSLEKIWDLEDNDVTPASKVITKTRYRPLWTIPMPNRCLKTPTSIASIPRPSLLLLNIPPPWSRSNAIKIVEATIVMEDAWLEINRMANIVLLRACGHLIIKDCAYRSIC